MARGFAAMDPEKRSEIARKGGRAAHAKGTAHEWTSEEAREAGKRGGEALLKERGPEHFRQMGSRRSEVGDG